MKKIKRVGIMGGTFNPIHLGHLILAEHAYEELNLDEVVFIPNKTPYLKDRTELLSSQIRVSLVHEAIADNPHFTLSTIEVDRGGNSYSYETIQTLTYDHPDIQYFFLVGADSLLMMDSWKFPEKIFSAVTVAVAIRNEHSAEYLDEQIHFLEKKYNASIIKLPCKKIEISSTQIRERVKSGKSIRYLVHDKTEQSIIKNKLYQTLSFP